MAERRKRRREQSTSRELFSTLKRSGDRWRRGKTPCRSVTNSTVLSKRQRKRKRAEKRGQKVGGSRSGREASPRASQSSSKRSRSSVRERRDSRGETEVLPPPLLDVAASVQSASGPAIQSLFWNHPTFWNSLPAFMAPAVPPLSAAVVSSSTMTTGGGETSGGNTPGGPAGPDQFLNQVSAYLNSLGERVKTAEEARVKAEKKYEGKCKELAEEKACRVLQEEKLRLAKIEIEERRREKRSSEKEKKTLEEQVERLREKNERNTGIILELKNTKTKLEAVVKEKDSKCLELLVEKEKLIDENLALDGKVKSGEKVAENLKQKIEKMEGVVEQMIKREGMLEEGLKSVMEESLKAHENWRKLAEEKLHLTKADYKQYQGLLQQKRPEELEEGELVLEDIQDEDTVGNGSMEDIISDQADEGEGIVKLELGMSQEDVDLRPLSPQPSTCGVISDIDIYSTAPLSNITIDPLSDFSDDENESSISEPKKTQQTEAG